MDFTSLIARLTRMENPRQGGDGHGPERRCPDCHRRHGRRATCQVVVIQAVRGRPSAPRKDGTRFGHQKLGVPKGMPRAMFSPRNPTELAWRRAFRGITPLWATQAMHGTSYPPAKQHRRKRGGRSNAAKKTARGWS